MTRDSLALPLRLALSPVRTSAFMGVTFLPLVSSTERPPCSQFLVCPVQGLSVLILAQGCHLVQVGHPGIVQRWGSSSLVCKGLMSWHFCCLALRIRVTLSSGSEQKQEVSSCEKRQDLALQKWGECLRRPLAWATENAGMVTGIRRWR